MSLIPTHEIEWNDYSWLDDAGKVFKWKSRVFRAIRGHTEKRIRYFFQCGLIDELVAVELFPKSWITDYSVEGFALVVEHQEITPLTYSYEWSFSMLKDAAITVLEVNKIANKYGFQLKDSHGSNILFQRMKPKFIDLGSFIEWEKGANWIGIQEYLQFYYFSLKIWSKGDGYVGRMSLFAEHGMMPFASYLTYRTCLPSKICRKLAVFMSRYYGYLSSKSKHVEQRLKALPGKTLLIKCLFDNKGVPRINFDQEKLREKILKINIADSKSDWGKYHNAYYAEQRDKPEITPRFSRIIDIIMELKDIESIIDVAGNQGALSTMINTKTDVKHIICLDYDEDAIDAMYCRAKNTPENIEAAIVQNLTWPMVNRDVERPDVRFKSDAVLALAVTHHLLLKQMCPIDKVLKAISCYSSKYVFIEFMPLGLYVDEYSPEPPSWYSCDWFRKEFTSRFQLLLEEEVAHNRVLFVGIKQ